MLTEQLLAQPPESGDEVVPGIDAALRFVEAIPAGLAAEPDVYAWLERLVCAGETLLAAADHIRKSTGSSRLAPDDQGTTANAPSGTAVPAMHRGVTPAERSEPDADDTASETDTTPNLERTGPVERRQQLEAILAGDFAHHGIADLRRVGGGLESIVYRADSRQFGAVAIKLPLQRFLSSGNEVQLDTRELLTQEFRLAQLAVGHGVPCPEPVALYTNDETVDFLVAEYVETDDTDAGLFALGGLVWLIHGLDLDPLPLVAMEHHSNVDSLVVERVGERYDRLSRRIGDLTPLRMPDDDTATPEPARLLHMDARPANLLVRGGEIRGIVDWSNALFGPPSLELARIAESGNLTREFAAGYGLETQDPFVHLDPRWETLYRLDTAVMLAHVFLDNDVPAVVRRSQLARVVVLADALAAGERPDDLYIHNPQLMQ